MYSPLVRDFLKTVVAAVGDLIAEGPVATFIRSWTPVGAGLAWVIMASVALGVGYESLVTAGRWYSTLLVIAFALGALVMVFVHLVRAEQRREQELNTMRLSRRRRPRGPGTDER